mmetsp:Transcript_40168/g.64573  ORF Transcript_40168/g.64573 Transcript_40168/m.64573 type:complete len:86 (-) Transcript_40168:212-469(-)
MKPLDLSMAFDIHFVFDSFREMRAMEKLDSEAADDIRARIMDIDDSFGDAFARLRQRQSRLLDSSGGSDDNLMGRQYGYAPHDNG